MGYYQTQVAAYQALGDWFDYLRNQGLYDNTRIIIGHEIFDASNGQKL